MQSYTHQPILLGCHMWPFWECCCKKRHCFLSVRDLLEQVRQWWWKVGVKQGGGDGRRKGIRGRSVVIGGIPSIGHDMACALGTLFCQILLVLDCKPQHGDSPNCAGSGRQHSHHRFEYSYCGIYIQRDLQQLLWSCILALLHQAASMWTGLGCLSH